ncbi:MAG: DUF1579 domain-containing protein [Phycisphaeraceae bacterium]|nr:MAG: DUF1579 domain-containing protein [Phycisphaeraceae bacterium]
MNCEPTPHHRWLHQLVGAWSFENECVMGPSGETMKSTGREVVRAVGDLWVVGELTGAMPDGSSMTGIMTVGYDPARSKYVGSWIGSPMTHMFVYEGTRDGNTLTLDTTGPSFTDPNATARYQDVVEIVSPDLRRLYSQAQGPDGSWVRFMNATFTRVRG